MIIQATKAIFFSRKADHAAACRVVTDALGINDPLVPFSNPDKVRSDHPDHGGKYMFLIAAEGDQKADHLFPDETQYDATQADLNDWRGNLEQGG